jgi:hypothetical protein
MIRILSEENKKSLKFEKFCKKKEQILANKEKEIQKLLSVVSNQYESPNQYSLLDQLLYESQR